MFPKLQQNFQAFFRKSSDHNKSPLTQHLFRYNGVCDKDGCDFHSWRLGDRNYLGPGMTVSRI